MKVLLSVVLVLAACGGLTQREDSSDNSNDDLRRGKRGTNDLSTAADMATAPPDLTTAPPAPDLAQPATNESPAAPVSASFTADTTTDFPNPERGFYYYAGDGLLDGSRFASDLDYIKSQGYRLGYAETNIGAYKTQNIPQSALDTMANNFGVARAKGMKLVLRFAYDYSGATDSDTTLAWVQAHTSQLKPILAANVDVIAFVQAGFIGMWGEWHHSSNNLETKANKRAVRDAVLAMVPTDIPVQFREVYPLQEDWYPTVLDASTAFTGSPQSRSGFHNDCYMSSANDRYTYPGSGTVADFTFTKTPLEQRQYVAALSEYAPFGGETCDGAADLRLSCTGGTDNAGLSGGILNEGPRYHLAYLNRGFYSAFEDQWITGGCYAAVSRSMGYRFQLDGISHQGAAARGQGITVELRMRNVGWARIFSARRVRVTLISGANAIVGVSDVELRALPSQASASTTIPIHVQIPAGATPGTYAVYLSMPDRYPTTADIADYAIRPANANTGTQAWDAAKARFASGTSVVVN